MDCKVKISRVDRAGRLLYCDSIINILPLPHWGPCMGVLAWLLIFDFEKPRLIFSCFVVIVAAVIIYLGGFQWQYFWIISIITAGWAILGNMKDRQLEIIALLESMQRESAEKQEALAFETRQDIADLREEIKEMLQEHMTL